MAGTDDLEVLSEAVTKAAGATLAGFSSLGRTLTGNPEYHFGDLLLRPTANMTRAVLSSAMAWFTGSSASADEGADNVAGQAISADGGQAGDVDGGDESRIMELVVKSLVEQMAIEACNCIECRLLAPRDLLQGTFGICYVASQVLIRTALRSITVSEGFQLAGSKGVVRPAELPAGVQQLFADLCFIKDVMVETRLPEDDSAMKLLHDSTWKLQTLSELETALDGDRHRAKLLFQASARLKALAIMVVSFPQFGVQEKLSEFHQQLEGYIQTHPQAADNASLSPERAAPDVALQTDISAPAPAEATAAVRSSSPASSPGVPAPAPAAAPPPPPPPPGAAPDPSTLMPARLDLSSMKRKIAVDGVPKENPGNAGGYLNELQALLARRRRGQAAAPAPSGQYTVAQSASAISSFDALKQQPGYQPRGPRSEAEALHAVIASKFRLAQGVDEPEERETWD